MDAAITSSNDIGSTVSRVGGSMPAQPAPPPYIDFNALKASQQAWELSVQTVRTVEGLYELEAEWRDLERRAESGINVFQSFDWCAAWSEIYVSQRDEASLYIVSIRDQDRLVQVWPLMMTCVGPFCVLRWLSDPYGQYGDVLTDPGFAKREVFELAWRHLVATSKVDTIRLRHVRSDGFIHDFLAANCAVAGNPQLAPYLDMAGMGDEAQYDARFSKAQRRRRKRIRTNLEKSGPVEFAVRNEPDYLDGIVDGAVRHKREWLAERGLHSGPVNNADFSKFLSLLANRCVGHLHVVTSQLSAGDEAMSHQVALKYFGRHLCYLTSHDRRYTNLSPARLHMDYAQRAAINVKTQVFDLMVPGDKYKTTWSSGAVETCDFYLPITVKGRVFGTGYLSLIRPLARKIYQNTPAGVRSRLTGVLGKA